MPKCLQFKTDNRVFFFLQREKNKDEFTKVKELQFRLTNNRMNESQSSQKFE